MIPLTSKLENLVIPLYELEKQLKPLGYTIGGDWDYEAGSLDYRMADDDGYQFIRIPFKVEQGMLDAPGALVRLGSPFILTHKYQDGIDEGAENGVFQGSVNQFQAPVDSDAEVPEKYAEKGKRLIEQIENILL
ncbi:YugN-like family protein [Aquibacillus rhizosphaerae]|uniref:YugN-like family protein n=1 Tax=Aquibacillus rhizosphaerae TaxID=3051431 RepID=A0ABT7L9K8_9BACI|nr:YugN-like family protein [Aquibacillus sp. LR5S19]MDL4842550.1 YugN-like family protein [Aquibacillus sp. LR5S19]